MDPYQLTDMQPLRDRLLVAPLAVPSRSRGGLHLPETSHERERPQHGIVLAIGPGNRTKDTGARVPMDVHPGDCIFYGKYSGQEFELGGRRILNMSELEVFSRLRLGTFTLVEHEHAKDNHLKGDYCDLCASPEELAAKRRLEEEREARVQAEREERAREINPLLVGGNGGGGKVSALEEERERLRRRQESPA